MGICSRIFAGSEIRRKVKIKVGILNLMIRKVMTI